MTENQIDSIVKQLFALKASNDSEYVHQRADELLWEAAPYEVRQAYLTVKLAQPWWVTA